MRARAFKRPVGLRTIVMCEVEEQVTVPQSSGGRYLRLATHQPMSSLFTHTRTLIPQRKRGQRRAAGGKRVVSILDGHIQLPSSFSFTLLLLSKRESNGRVGEVILRNEKKKNATVQPVQLFAHCVFLACAPFMRSMQDKRPGRSLIRPVNVKVAQYKNGIGLPPHS